MLNSIKVSPGWAERPESRTCQSQERHQQDHFQSGNRKLRNRKPGIRKLRDRSEEKKLKFWSMNCLRGRSHMTSQFEMIWPAPLFIFFNIIYFTTLFKHSILSISPFRPWRHLWTNPTSRSNNENGMDRRSN